jgi:hypothetical protein
MNIKIPSKCSHCGYAFIDGDIIAIETIAHIKYEQQSPIIIPDGTLGIKAYHDDRKSDVRNCFQHRRA